LSVLFVAAYRSLLISPLLEVTRINVSGCQQLDPQVLIEQAGIPSGANILSLDLTAIHRRVTSHPRVLAAVITREIPDRILIEIEERQPLAMVRAHDFYLVDMEGVCFARAAPAKNPGLPIISGLDPDTLGLGRHLPQEFTTRIQDFHRECQRQLPWRLISEITWDRDAGLSFFTLRGGIQVDLGRNDYGRRIARLERVLRYLEKNGAYAEIRRVDLSHGDRVFVTGNFQRLQQGKYKQRGV
jgi:cell division septal protein FtsQ